MTRPKSLCIYCGSKTGGGPLYRDAAATLGSYALARAADGTSQQEARTAAMLALFAVSLWVLGLVAGRAAWRLTLIPAVAALPLPLPAIPPARPPPPLAAAAGRGPPAARRSPGREPAKPAR